MKSIIGIGNALVDVLVRLESDEQLARLGLEKGGMQLIDDERQLILSAQMQQWNPAKATGGSAGNAMLALANLGAKPGFVGRVGNDDMGRFFADNCDAVGIEARLVSQGGATGVANTFISPDAERTFATYLGVAGQMAPEGITPELFRGYDILHIEGYLVQNHALIRRICEVARQLGMTTSIDLASYNVVDENRSLLRELVVNYIDIVFANEEESAAFTCGKSPEEALHEIASMARWAVVKVGKRGSMGMFDGTVVSVPGKQVGVVDTTAAGDFFAGGFLYALSQGAGLEQCLRMGSLLSQNIIQIVGTRLPEQTWEEIRSEAAEMLRK